MGLAQKFETAREKLKSEGWRALAKHAAAKFRNLLAKSDASTPAPWETRKKLVDSSFDRIHGVSTGGTTSLAGLTINGPYRRFGTVHIASDPDEFAEAVGSLQINYEDFTYIDLGSGKGRSLVLALSYPFRRIVGVEFALELHRTAEANLAGLAATGTDIGRIELCHADATSFNFPTEPSVIYLYNPFDGPIMSMVAQRVLRSLTENPRPIFILYSNPLLESDWNQAGFMSIKRGATFSLLVPP